MEIPSLNFAPCILALELMAILAICFFHIWPSQFGNGFLGVDMLFVIWGFFAASKLYQLEKQNCLGIVAKLRIFYGLYLRQIILPSILTICLTLIGGFSLFLEKEWNLLITDAQWAMGFAINHEFTELDWSIEMLGLPHSRPLLYFWVISIFLQFNAFFPLFFTIAQFFIFNSKSFFFNFFIFPFFLIFFFIPSFLLWLLYPSKAISMGWMFARIWQFILGIIAFLAYAKSFKEENVSSKSKKVDFLAIFHSRRSILEHLIFYILGLFVGFILFLPSIFWPPIFHYKIILSIFLGILSAFLLYFYPTKLKRNFAPLPSSKFLAEYFSHFPFILFLFHQPISEFLKYYLSISLLSIQSGFLALGLIIICAFFANILFIFCFKNVKFPTIFIILIFAYIFAFFCIISPKLMPRQNRLKSDPTLPIFNESIGRIQFKEFNVNNSRILLEQLQMDEFIRRQLIPHLNDGHKIKLNEMLKSTFTFDPLILMPGNESNDFVEKNQLKIYSRHVNRIFEWKIKGKGHKNILLFGNSHGQVIWRELEQIFQSNYSKLHVITVPACMPIFERDWRTIYGISCAQIHKALMNLLQKQRPDVLFLVFKWYEELAQKYVEGKMENDEIFKQFNSFLLNAQKMVKEKIFISAPNLQFEKEISQQISKRIWQNKTLAELNKKYKMHLMENKWNYARMNAIKCGKCIFFDLADIFCDKNDQEGICNGFDPFSQLAYFSDTNHLSYFGRLKAKPFLRKMIEKIFH